jgi:imidazole glycerol-phosphate synthase subunit HisH
MIGVLDYGVGNVGAFLRIYHSHNVDAMLVRAPDDFIQIDKIILPGVGSFDSAMEALNKSGLRDTLDGFVLTRNLPLLGVCIGMHMLGKYSEEGSAEGLSYIQGVTKKMSARNLNTSIQLPHMGWNDIKKVKFDPIWEGIDEEEGFYFLHSYCFAAEYGESVIGTSDYQGTFTCAVMSKNIYGFQFHPEKSLVNGTRLLLNFAADL